jgi:hypothetical protein
MANQLNFPDPLSNDIPVRPQRVAQEDLELAVPRQTQIIFGTDPREVVEIWVYNPDGSFAGHLTLEVTDPALGHVTLVDNTGTFELVDLDFTSLCKRMGIEPGRYTIVANFFRDEVGSENSHKLYITDISDDRTEVRLKPVFNHPEVVRDLYEFTAPSVPKRYAQGLLDQTLQASLDFTEDESLSPKVVAEQLNAILENTVARLKYSGTWDIYSSILKQVVERTQVVALQLLKDDAENRYIQQNDLNSYILQALEQVITEVVARGELDPRLAFI